MEGFWLYCTNEDHEFYTGIKGRLFSNEWLSIYEDGHLIVKGSHGNGYAWDGCSPKFVFLDIIWGTPDGAINKSTKKPKTYYASMVHDVLYQYGALTGVSRYEADRLFCQMLKGFLWRYVYCLAVRLLGKWSWNRCIKQQQ